MRKISLLLALSLSGPALAQNLGPVVGKDRKVQVYAGENLYELGLRYGLAIEHFAFANRMPVQLTVASAREIVIPSRRTLPLNPPSNGVVVNLPERGAFLFRNGEFEKFYPVAIGQPGRFATPTGQFKFISLVKDPTWMPPEWAGLGADTVVPAGPDNPLGDRWMGLSMPGLGMHSTTNPASIGSAASHGCMRMYPPMARELFDKLQVGYSARIEYEPIKLGRDPETGSLSISIFPDVYGQRPLAARAQELLDSQGLSDWIDGKQLSAWLAQPQGVPQVFADGQVGLSSGGQNISEPGMVLKSAQGVFVSVEALRRLGVTADYDSATREVRMTWQETTQSFPSEGYPRLAGKLYLPARQVLNSLGIPFQWDSAAKSLVVG